MANSVDPDHIGAVYSGSTLFVSILNSSVMLGNYLQQTISANDIFRCRNGEWLNSVQSREPLTPFERNQHSQV